MGSWRVVRIVVATAIMRTASSQLALPQGVGLPTIGPRWSLFGGHGTDFFPPRNDIMRSIATVFCSAVLVCSCLATARAADEYAYDGVHSSVSFKARHLEIGRAHV